MEELLQRLLSRDEGYRRCAYTDSLGYWTIGIGRLIDSRKGGGVSVSEALYLLENDVAVKVRMLEAQLPWFATLDPVRRAVLVSMAFQLGVAGLMGFHHTLAAAAVGDWDTAASAMLTSRWAQQAPLRSHRLSEAMRTGDEAAFQLAEDPPPVLSY